MVRRIRPRLKLMLRSYDIPFQDADDLLQDSLLEAVRKWEHDLQPGFWLLGTLRFKCSNYWKRVRNKIPQSMALPDLEELCEPLPPPQEKVDEAFDLRHAMSGLDPRHRRALWLRFAVGFTPEEVADQLGYCHSSVRKLTQRAMMRLRREANLAGPPPAEPDDSNDSEEPDEAALPEPETLPDLD